MVRYTDLIADTILEHGEGWAYAHFARRLPRWMLDIFFRSPPVVRAAWARQHYVMYVLVPRDWA